LARVNLSKVRGHSIEILRILEYASVSLRTVDIAEIMGKSANYVRRYLYSLRDYGLIERCGGAFWALTSDGIRFLQYLNDVEDLKGKLKVDENEKI